MSVIKESGLKKVFTSVPFLGAYKQHLQTYWHLEIAHEHQALLKYRKIEENLAPSPA